METPALLLAAHVSWCLYDNGTAMVTVQGNGQHSGDDFEARKLLTGPQPMPRGMVQAWELCGVWSEHGAAYAAVRATENGWAVY